MTQREVDMSSNADKKPDGDLKDKLSSLFGFQNPPGKKDDLPPKAHFSIWYFLIVFLLFTLIQQYFLSPKIETIPYSKFKEYLSGGQVSNLTIGPESISGKIKEKGKPDQEFATVRVEDPSLTKELDEKRVSYSGLYQSKFLGTLLSWIIPIGLFFLI